jgi:hypothetical protein
VQLFEELIVLFFLILSVSLVERDVRTFTLNPDNFVVLKTYGSHLEHLFKHALYISLGPVELLATTTRVYMGGRNLLYVYSVTSLEFVLSLVHV